MNAAADTTADISTADAYRRRIVELEAQLAEAQETLDAIRSGEVDAVVVGDADDRRVFTLESADRPYRLLIEEMREGAVTLSADGVILYCNGAFATLVGEPASQIVGTRMKRFLLEPCGALDALLADEGRAELTLCGVAGETAVQLSLSRLPVEEGWLLGGVITDLTETRRHAHEMADAQARLEVASARRESDERNRLILESATDYAIISTDLDGLVTVWNTGAHRILGWSADEITGRSAHLFWTPEDRAAGEPEMEMATALRNGRAQDERYHLRRNGSRFWANGLMMPLQAEDGAVIGFLKILRDRTAERETEAAREAFAAELERRVEERTGELAAANDRLQVEIAERTRTEEALRQSQKMEAIGQLTGGVAHDFNNLLTIIRSSVDLLRRRELPEERRRRYIDAISDTADRAAKLTGQLLAYARKQPLRPETFDVAARVRDTADMVLTTVGTRVQVVSDIRCEPCFVEADANQFETALLNMAVNARDAIAGDGTLTITVDEASVAGGGFVALTVSDTGQGIAPDRLERIFEPFYTTKGVGKGTGLGLSQVYGFAKQSGGEVRVASEVGTGTAFTLYLPRIEAPADAAPERAEAATGPAYGRILLVEDNAQVGEVATQLLEELGYTVNRAEDARSALALVETGAGAFDLVFSDVVMPGDLSGVELGQLLRRSHPELPVVLTTGYSETLADGVTDGVALLRKPYSVEALSRILRVSLARR